MIRINLAKSQSYSASGTQVNFSLGNVGLSTTGSQVLKVLCMIIGVIGLIVFEKYNLSQKKIEVAKINQKVQELEAEITSYGSVESAIDDLTKEKEKVNKQLSVIQRISQKRARKLDSIVSMQKSLPPDLWVKDMNLSATTLVLNGYSKTPTSVQQVVKALGEVDHIDSAFNRELTRIKLGNETLQEFKIEARISQK